MDSIVYAFCEGCSFESIPEDFNGLTLAHVYGAIASHLGYQSSIETYLGQRKEQWSQMEALVLPQAPAYRLALNGHAAGKCILADEDALSGGNERSSVGSVRREPRLDFRSAQTSRLDVKLRDFTRLGSEVAGILKTPLELRPVE